MFAAKADTKLAVCHVFMYLVIYRLYHLSGAYEALYGVVGVYSAFIDLGAGFDVVEFEVV